MITRLFEPKALAATSNLTARRRHSLLDDNPGSIHKEGS
jgi:hypothetical protein